MNLDMQSRATRIGTIEMVVAMMLSGTIGYFVIQSGQAYWNVVFFRCVIGVLTLGAYAYFTGMLKRDYFQSKILLIIILGGVTLVANWVLLFASFNHIPFSIATVAYHTQPLFLVLFGAYLTREKLSAPLFFWLALSFIGLFFMVELDVMEIKQLFSSAISTDQISTDQEVTKGQVESASALIGLLMALGAALLYTATTLITKKVSHIPPHFVALVQVIVGVFMLLPFADFSQLPTQTSQWMDLVILGVVHTGFMYIIMYDSFQKLPTSLLALLSFIYPVMALAVDYVAFATQISWLQGLGVTMILLSVCAVKFNWGLKRKVVVKGS